MADAIVSRLGQQDGSGDPESLFLKVFSGEVLTAFYSANVMLDRTTVRSISSGKSAQFPATWKGTAQYHVPGTEITGTTINHNERVVAIDDLLIADRFIASIDEAMNHYDVRSIYSFDAGQALSRTLDKNLQQLVLLAARASSTVAGGTGGTVITSANSKTSADSLVAAIFAGAQALDEKNVPSEDRYVILPPALYYLLVNSSSKAIHQDYTAGVNGGVDSGVIFRVAGMPIVKTNNFPSTVISSGPTAYQGTFTTDSCAIFHKSAVGTVKLIDLGMEMGWDMRRQGTLMLAKMAVGSGILRPEAAVEVKTS